MAKSKADHQRLTAEEFTALKQVENRSTQRTITDNHRNRLIAAGYIREVLRVGGVNVIALTGSGIRRLERGK